MRSIYLVSLFALFFGGCKTSKKQDALSTISISINAPEEGKIVLTQVGFVHEKSIILDSSKAPISYQAEFYIKKTSNVLIELRIPALPETIYLIPDADSIKIDINTIHHTYTLVGSPATNMLKHFTDELAITANATGNWHTVPLPYNNRNSKLSTEKNQFHFLNSFADTVSNSVLFLLAYNNIDFGKDLELAQKLLKRAMQRFNGNKNIEDLYAGVLKTKSIFDIEYYVGDSLPIFQLPDLFGKPYSTGLCKGKYYFINFWSTWCTPCFNSLESMKQISNKVDTSTIKLISVAMDDNVEDCKMIIEKNKLHWIQLIDEQMWQGVAVNTLKFDSIPFNYLVSPAGRILAKAIPPDSISLLLKRFFKK